MTVGQVGSPAPHPVAACQAQTQSRWCHSLCYWLRTGCGAPAIIVDAVALASQQHGSVAAGSRDSGGPVFTLAADPNKVVAAGLTVAGVNQLPCQIAGPTTCFNTVAFVDITYILGAHNTRLLTQ
jgi:hypothetical protein